MNKDAEKEIKEWTAAIVANFGHVPEDLIQATLREAMQWAYADAAKVALNTQTALLSNGQFFSEKVAKAIEQRSKGAT